MRAVTAETSCPRLPVLFHLEDQRRAGETLVLGAKGKRGQKTQQSRKMMF